MAYLSQFLGNTGHVPNKYYIGNIKVILSTLGAKSNHYGKIYSFPDIIKSRRFNLSTADAISLVL